jgi:hypothetical protein
LHSPNSSPLSHSYLHDDELQSKRQLSDVTNRQVKEKGSVPHSVVSPRPFGLLRTDHLPILTQVDDYVVICRDKRATINLRERERERERGNDMRPISICNLIRSSIRVAGAWEYDCD